MTRYNIRKRDGLARTGILETTAGTFRLPAILDTEHVFPSLRQQEYTNVPLSSPEPFVKEFIINQGEQPVFIHPHAPVTAASGDCVMPGSWHTALSNPRSYTDWLVQMKQKLPVDTAWYAPACALPANVAILCYTGFDIFDNHAVDIKSSQGIFCTPEGEFPAGAISSGICSCPGCQNGNLKEHNRSALAGEAARVAWFIEQGQLRDLVESRCRMDAPQVAILRHLDIRYSEFMEQNLPVARGHVLRANSAESMMRAEVKRFAARVISRYIPPKTDVAVLLPCSAKKPYSLSQSHRKFIEAVGGRAHELIVTSPLGLVPRELETIYPAGHYDVPVTGYWDAEECATISSILVQYFRKNPYRRIIAHLEGGALNVARMAAQACGISLECTCTENPGSSAALNRLDAALAGERRIKDDRLHGMISYQFGCNVETKGTTLRGHFPEIYYSRNNVQIFSIDTSTGLLRPTFDGWNLIPSGYRVYIDDFTPEGDVLVPGVSSADPGIRDGDEILVVGKRALATGKAAMPSEDMLRSKRGVAVRVRKIKRL